MESQLVTATLKPVELCSIHGQPSGLRADVLGTGAGMIVGCFFPVIRWGFEMHTLTSEALKEQLRLVVSKELPKAQRELVRRPQTKQVPRDSPVACSLL